MSPTWYGYPSVMIAERACPAASWLVGHGFEPDTDLHQNLNGDGVSLLMGYALNLDPTLNLLGSLPLPAVGADTLSHPFHASTVETSTDLQYWTTEGVTLSDLNPDDIRIASVNRDSPQRFLRLVV